MSKKVESKAFTLIEICMAIALMGLLAGVIGWHLIKMADLQQFRKHVGFFVTHLQKLQVIALSRRCDLNVKIVQRDGEYFYATTSDEPLFLKAKNRQTLIKGVRSLSRNGRIISQLDLNISSTGRIEPYEKIGFFLGHSLQGEAIWLDLRTPLQMKCSIEKSILP